MAMSDTITGACMNRQNSPDDAAGGRTRDDLAKAYQQSGGQSSDSG